MSKFDSELTEAAYTIANHGFAEQEFGSAQEYGWNALVVVSPTLLLNLGEVDLRHRLANAGWFIERLVWVNEDANGNVGVLDSGYNHAPFTILIEETFYAEQACHESLSSGSDETYDG